MLVVSTLPNKRKAKRMVYKIETPAGFLPYEFPTKQAALDYVMAALSWQGTRYRIVRARAGK